MNRLKRILALTLAIMLVYGMFAGLVVNAATLPVNIYVDKYESGALDFRWDSLPGVQSAVITYHTPDDTDAAVLNTNKVNHAAKATITGLKSDYIYDIDVKLYSQEDGAGELLGEGLLYYLPKITFFAAAVAPVPGYTDILPGGRESGDKPELKLRWMEPKAYNGAADFVFVTHVADVTDSDGDGNTTELVYSSFILTQMQNELNRVYKDGRVLKVLNYRINISTDLAKINGGSAQAAIIINDQGGQLKANVSTSVNPPSVTSAVYGIDDNGYYSFNLVGRKDNTIPDAPDEDPNDYKLPDKEILPGTVYFMNIKPVFADTANNPVNAVTSGNPADQNGSMLSGLVSYTYTPIRFQLSKDNANNIYIKIYKINQGSLDLPRLFYQFQASDDPSAPGDWTVKKTMDDTYFSGNFAITAITGVNPDNEIYYKVVVKSDSPNDRLESLKMPYMLSTDTSKPPVPMGIEITNRTLELGTVVKPNTNPASNPVSVKSTNVTISWDMPANWNSVKDDLVYYFMLSTSQSDLTTEVPLFVDGAYWESYIPKYRLVKYVDAKNLGTDGNRLSYTLNAFDLFKGELVNGGNVEVNDIDNPDGYPSFLAPNTVYYLKMFTTKKLAAPDDYNHVNTSDMSDQSLIVSFTTLSGVELGVPLPLNFKLETNGKDTTVIPNPINYIELTFDKVTDLDWRNYTSNYDPGNYDYDIYYDIYMNSRTDTDFTLIGTTEVLNGAVNVTFTGADDPTSTSIKARVSKFVDDAKGAITKFGNFLLPNTTYYFTAKTRLVIQKKDDPADKVEKISMDTAILPVTTIVIDITPPDDNDRKPLAVTDFSIALDPDGNQMLSGNSVTFTWERREDDVVYELIRTGQRVDPTDGIGTYELDPEYTSFLDEYDLPSDGVTNEKVYLDPDNPNPAVDPAIRLDGAFTYDPSSKMCTLTIDWRLFPNKLYYFSIKAVRLNSLGVSATESVWTSIPVTTSLIEAPLDIQAVNDAQLGFFWVDATPGLTAEDYRIYAKGPGDSDYKLMTRSTSTIVKDKDGRTYYGRIMNLKVDSTYNIRVFKGAGEGTLVYEKRAMSTRDGFHEIEVRWKGQPVDNYSYYEIAIRAEGESEYTTLTASDLEQFTDKDGKLLPYYTEEMPQTVNTGDLYFNARIKKAVVTLPGGIQSRQPLKSNVKYYVKVRAVKIDAADAAVVSYSKYVGPVDTRTEFNQDDYDNEDRDNENEAVFLDRMKQLEKGNYWRIGIGDSDAVQIILKGDIVANAISNSSEGSFVVDLSQLTENIGKDVVYVPVSVLKAMNAKNTSLVIRTSESEYVLRPRTLDAEGNQQLTELIQKPAVKDLYLMLTIVRGETLPVPLPSSNQRISAVNDLAVEAQGASISEAQLKKLVHDKLYNEEDGLVSGKLNMLLNAYLGSGSDATKKADEYTAKLIELIEKELSEYINDTLEEAKLRSAAEEITQFEAPVSARLSFEARQGMKIPYALYDGASAWQKISSNVVQTPASLTFNVSRTGKYVVALAQSTVTDVADGYWAKDYITKLTSNYDLSAVFPGINSGFSPDNPVSGQEIILLYETVTGRASAGAGLDIKQKSAKLGLNSIINPSAVLKNIKRQETAAVLIKLFAVKKGVSESSLRAGGNILLNDEANIDDRFYNQVLLAVDMKLMETDAKRNFRPGANVTRAEVAVAFVKLLQLTGDIQ